MSTIDLQPIFRELEVADPKKPWRTAKTLARKCLGSEGSGDEVHDALYRYYGRTIEEGGTPLARYSNYPSRRSLEPIWASVKHVKNLAVQPLQKYDAADKISFDENEDLIPFSRDNPSLFISHSHRDYEDVVAIARDLLPDWTPWLAEVEIEKKDVINPRIIESLTNTDECLVFLSRNALRSVWTGKEVHFGMRAQKRVHFVLDTEDPDIAELRNYLLDSGGSPPDAMREIWRETFRRIREDSSDAFVYEYKRHSPCRFKLSRQFQLPLSGQTDTF